MPPLTSSQLLKSRLQTLNSRPPTVTTRQRSSYITAESDIVAEVQSNESLSEADKRDFVSAIDSRIANLEQQVTTKTAEVVSIQTELALLERSYASLQHAMDRSSDELSGLRQVNAQLQVKLIFHFVTVTPTEERPCQLHPFTEGYRVLRPAPDRTDLLRRDAVK